MNVNYSIDDVYAFLLESDDGERLFSAADFGGKLETLRAFVRAFLDDNLGSGSSISGTKMTVLGIVDEHFHK